MRTLLLAACLLAAGCNLLPSSFHTGKDLSDSLAGGRASTLNRKSLMGAWQSGEDASITMDIGTDSVFYTEHGESYRYTLSRDSILIHYPEFTWSGKVRFRKDTLVLESEEGISTYVRIQD